MLPENAGPLAIHDPEHTEMGEQGMSFACGICKFRECFEAVVLLNWSPCSDVFQLRLPPMFSFPSILR